MASMGGRDSLHDRRVPYEEGRLIAGGIPNADALAVDVLDLSALVTPVTVDLSCASEVVVRGPAEVAHALARSLICRLAVAHGMLDHRRHVAMLRTVQQRQRRQPHPRHALGQAQIGRASCRERVSSPV